MSSNASDVLRLLPRPVPRDDDRRLLLFAIRRIAAFGLGFRRPLILVRALMAELSRIAAHRILVAPCCCPRMTLAEAALIDAVAMADRDARAAHRRLSAMLGVGNCLGALASAQALGQAFADLGRPLFGDGD
ncbi:hypothetical protein CLG96_17405 [Sphingomonas oleivorans]|uniref:Uncharacterized protein n=1 Tax=Sphingomonas oleivorans TaxID=1735121 RepID=A0A2T5FTE1_9SPHN|nr:DUF6628 family protein [Sphingomonas oleivorans]PTQ07331.1 hypothetical protein CLG96_17405 [Sphingomonas oleivorans]